MRRRGYLAGIGTGIGALVAVTDGTTRVTAEDLSVRILETNDPVEGGEFLDVVAEVANETTSAAEVEARLVIGDEPVGGTWRFTLEGGESRTLEFSHLTFPVRRDVTFPVRVATRDEVDERTVEVYGIDELADELTRPDRRLAVTPGTTVTFEVESDVLGAYGGRTRWFLEGSYAGWSMGPWYAEYYAHEGRDYWQRTFDSPGAYDVVAGLVGDERNERASWTVEVEPDGNESPNIEGAHPSPGRLAVATDETVELSVDVTDPDDELDRVVWWLGHADVILGVSSVDGSEDTATLEVDGSRLCHSCPVHVWVISADGTTASADVWTVTETDGGPVEVSIAETNAPVGAGDWLEVDVELENVGDLEATREVTLVVGGEEVDASTASVPAGGTATLTLGYETYPVRTDVEFPVRVKTSDDVDQRTVAVYADGVGEFDVTILETNSPVGAGEFLEVVAEVENTGEETTSQDVHLFAGDRVDTEAVTLEPGETETIELGYETYPVETNVEFPVTVETNGAADRELVRVYADALPSLSPTILGTNAPVEAGEFLEVDVELENTGETSVTEDVALIVGGETVDSASVTVSAGGTETLVLGYETYPVQRDVSFPIVVEADGDRAETTVDVVAPDDDEKELEVDFVDCTRVEVSGTFEDGDTISAHTLFNTTAGVGTTVGEDWITIGDDVPAPFSGTIVFEVGDDRDVSGDDAEATVTVADRGEFGTAITGISDPSALGMETTHSNPHDCTAAILPDRPSLAVDDVAPRDGVLDVTFSYENPNDATLAVGSEFTAGTTDDEPSTELEPGSDSFTATWTPETDDERLEWTVDLSAFGDEEPVRASTGPAGEYVDDDPEDGQLAVRDVGTNAPVQGGEFLEVDAELENTGEAELSQSVDLVVGGEVVDSTTATVDGGATVSVALGYETYPVEGDVSFTIRVETEDDSFERTVEVFGTGDEE